MSMSKIRVFISSSMEELEPESAITELHLKPVAFEGLPTLPKSLKDAYLDEVQSS